MLCGSLKNFTEWLLEVGHVLYCHTSAAFGNVTTGRVVAL